MDTFFRLREVIATDLCVDPQTIEPGSRFVQDLGADSLALTELILKLERAFSVTIPDDALRRLRRVEDVVRFIEERGLATAEAP